MRNIAAICVLLATFPAAYAAEQGALVKVPPADQILATLRKPHPRLLASAQDFDQLKRRIQTDALLKEWYAKLKTEAEDLIDAPPSKYEIPDGLRLLATSRRVVNRTYTLALVCRVENDSKYADRLWKELSAAAEFPDWNPKHFLDTAEMTHAFAIGLDWLHDRWTEAQKNQLRQAMVEKGLKPALGIYKANRGWARVRHNWNQVCNGGVGMGALALAEVEPELSAEILKGAIDSLPLAMAEFAPDGAWNEGPGYWNYATMYNVVFVAGLESALGTDFGLSRIKGFSETGLFPLYVTGPLDRTFNYADGGDRGIHGSQIFWFSRRFDQPVLSWYQKQIKSPSALDVLWYQSKGVSPKQAGLPLDKYYRAAEVVVLRGAWEDKNASFVGFKAGDNKANHSHLDLGSFVFDALGVRWAVDVGADNYNLPGFFGAQRWNYYRLRGEGQNTMVVNPGTGPDQDPTAATKIVAYGSTSNRAFAVADISAAYKKHVTKAMRGVALLDRSRLLIQDEIQAQNDVDAWWFMHTGTQVEVSTDGRVAILSDKGAKVRAEIVSSGKGRFQMMDAKPLPGSPHPEKQAENKGVRKLSVHLEQVTDATLTILLTPQDGKTYSQPTQTDLAHW